MWVAFQEIPWHNLLLQRAPASDTVYIKQFLAGAINPHKEG